MTSEKRLSFSSDSQASKILMQWWTGLEEDRASRAELRRCRSPSEVVFCPAYHRLLHGLQPVGPVRREALAAVAGLLAHVAAHETSSLASHMGASAKGASERARVSGLRFRRLLRFQTRSELYGPFLRILRLLERRANVLDLARSIYWWNERTRRQWALDYYTQAPTEA